MIECFGPYLFNQDAGSPIAGALLEACIGAIAKTPAVGLINLPFFIAGGIKLMYDALLYRGFRSIRPPEEAAVRQPGATLP